MPPRLTSACPTRPACSQHMDPYAVLELSGQKYQTKTKVDAGKSESLALTGRAL